MRTRTSLIGLALVSALLSSACSGSVDFSFGGQTPAEAAVDLIEGDEMAQRLGIGAITGAVCELPADTEVGTVFACTATSGGETVDFEVELEADDRIFAAPTNVVDESFLVDYATSAVQSLNSANGLSLPEDAMDCGDRSVVLDADQQMICELIDPTSGIVYDAALTITDTNLGTFAVEILDSDS